MICIRKLLRGIKKDEVELVMASKKKASCSDLHLKIIGERNGISGYLDSAPDIHIPGSEIEIDEYASSPLSYDTIGWWTETHDMIPLMANSRLPERKRKSVLAEFYQYDRCDLFGPDVSEKGIDTLSHIWGKEVEQAAVREVLDILESTSLHCSKPGSGNFDVAYHSPHNFSRIEIHPYQKCVRLFVLGMARVMESEDPFSYYTVKNRDAIEYVSGSPKWKRFK